MTTYNSYYDLPCIMGRLPLKEYWVWDNQRSIRRDECAASGSTIEEAISNYQKKTGYQGPIIMNAFPPWRVK